MKLKLRIVLPILACTAIAAVHAAGDLDGLLQPGDEDLVRSFQNYPLTDSLTPRDLTSTSTFDLVAISPSNYYIYMAMSAKERRAYADRQLSVGKLDTTTGIVDITGISPAIATVDGVSLSGAAGYQNPLFVFPADRLTTFGAGLPVVAYMDKSLGMVKEPYAVVALPTSTSGDTVLTTTYSLNYTDGYNGINYLKDALSVGVTSTIQALTSSSSYIFAAVPDSNRKWSDNDAVGRGIAVIKQETSKLTPLNVTSWATIDADAAKASKIDVASYDPAATSFEATKKIIHAFGPATGTSRIAGISNAAIGEGATLYWDSTLERLYIGLSHVHRNDVSKSGGVLALSMGYLDSTPSFTIQPIIYIQRRAGDAQFNLKNLFNRNTNKQIIGNYSDYTNSTTNDAQVSIKHITSMHTSSGYSYLIVNSVMQNSPKMVGGILVEDVVDGVFALPLFDNTTTASAKGTIAATYRNNGRPVLDSSDYFITPTGSGTLVDFTITPSAPFAVGGNYPPDGGFINDLFVEGDTVFACVNGYKAQEAGIFASTALFNPKGVIRSWSPWQRVMGNLERTWGGKLNPSTGNFYAMTAQGNLPVPAELKAAADMNKELFPYYINSGTARVTQWGESQVVTANDNLLLDEDGTDLHTTVSFHTSQNLLTGIIGQTGTDFRSMLTLDEFTPGFKQGQFSMDVIWTDSTVDLVRTGTYNNGEFVPVVTSKRYKRAESDDGTVFELTDATHAVNPRVGNITCAEVSRIGLDLNTTSSAGFLFVGGTAGVAVWQKAGNGWITTASSNNPKTGLGDFLDISATFTFNKMKITNGNATDLDLTCTTSVVRICADGANTSRTAADDGKIYILTKTELFQIPKANLTAQHIKAGRLRASNYPINARANTYFTNMIMLSKDLGVVATTKGLYKFDGSATFGPAALTAIDGVNVTESSGAYTINTAYYHMIYIPAYKGGSAAQRRDSGTVASETANGTLYVVQGDVYNMSGKIYRFDVSGTTITLINNVADVATFADFAKFRSAFITDGAVAIMTTGKSVDNTELMSITPISSAALGSSGLVNSETGITSSLNNTADINEDITIDSRICGLTRDAASGAWIIPSSEGVRVNL